VADAALMLQVMAARSWTSRRREPAGRLFGRPHARREGLRIAFSPNLRDLRVDPRRRAGGLGRPLAGIGRATVEEVSAAPDTQDMIRLMWAATTSALRPVLDECATAWTPLVACDEAKRWSAQEYVAMRGGDRSGTAVRPLFERYDCCSRRRIVAPSASAS